MGSRKPGGCQGPPNIRGGGRDATGGGGVYVLVIAPLRGMLLVYKPEGGGLINRNILSEGAISDLQPVAMWLTSKRGVWLLVTLLAAG